MAGQIPCAHHEGICEILDDHEQRLRQKRDRIMKLEMKGEAMSEKMDTIMKQNADIGAKLDGLRSWQLYLMGGAGAVAVIYSLVTAHWGAISKLIGAGG